MPNNDTNQNEQYINLDRQAKSNKQKIKTETDNTIFNKTVYPASCMILVIKSLFPN